MLLVFLVVFKLNSDFSSVTAREQHYPGQFPHTLTGNIRLHRNFTSRFLPNRDLIVYLPPGYEEDTRRRYPVLYMQDGQNVFDSATSFFPGIERQLDERAEALINKHALQPLIIVGIYSTGLNRINEYTPTRLMGQAVGGEADLYGRMLLEEIKPFVDLRYRTLPGPSNTGLGGSSLGGLLTIHLGLKHPATFGKLAVTSPACFWDRETVVNDVRAIATKTNQRIWLEVGTAEPADFLTSTRSLHEALVEKNWKEGIDLRYIEVTGGWHNPASWAQQVDRLLTFLFPAVDSTRSRR
jgi:predicted alpha/beta superfamily hydrolase